ncbi:peptidase C11 [candidate division KSB1 bacterium]|nr:peptidase C11 [candidate division KSB1 bacterium]
MGNELSKKKWTVMVYLAGDNNLDSAGVVDLLEMKEVGSTSDINIIAQFDRRGKFYRTKRYFLQKDSSLNEDEVADLGETNTGDPDVLQSFIEWGAENYPANHYLLVIWNHGAGWNDTDVYRAINTMNYNVTRKHTVAQPATTEAQGAISTSQIRKIADQRLRRALFSVTINAAITTRGIAYDDNAQDFLDNLELKAVLNSATSKIGQKLDIVGMDACLMNMVEVAYQMRENVACIVGSEETEPGDGWPYHTILTDLAAKPTMTPDEFSAIIVQKYLDSYSPGDKVTQSAFDLAQCTTLANAIDELAKTMTGKLNKSSVVNMIMRVRNQVQSYDVAEYIDLVDFCKLLRSRTSQKALKAACLNVINAVQTSKFVIATGYKGSAVSHSYGVSIYFPTRNISSLYATLDFTNDTTWDEFLAAYLKATGR